MMYGNKNDKMTSNTTVMLNKRNNMKRILISIIALLLVTVIISLFFFPVHRLLYMTYTYDYFNKDEIDMLKYRGDISDRTVAREIIKEANAAFNDCGHTNIENEERYGKLAVFAINVEWLEDAYRSNHSINLWSANFDKTQGYMWVCYSQFVYNYDGDIIYTCLKQPALWRLKKNNFGKWNVIEIKMHP